MKVAVFACALVGGTAHADDTTIRSAALTCNATTRQFKGEQLRITIDPATLSGEIYRLSAGKALVRHVHVFAKGTPEQYQLVFMGYFPDDHQTIRRKSAPSEIVEDGQ
jgi:hypothetical protein